MAPARSDEAAQGSVGTGSNQALVEPAKYASNRVTRWTHDTAAPVRVTMALLPFSQPGVPSRRDHTELLHSIDNLFGDAVASTTTGSGSGHNDSSDERSSIEEMLRGIGGRFDRAQSSSGGSSATAGRQ
ncbi:uncharacterized protein F4807DRAFT_73545 [Annulohypoxylon truncatum]|uniref:uncharacterized protein n=1 Tax=Annulohypoxylon truncatum TaxID=327061 RepID=UPI0020088425|nr:uncharacterized protein F4807DRAFT_73545 [Annulohypoxylon truncatum]KAI1210233.1 hypothetical protein F4807DRAFT_73545 [Annulohypoxylon truncatum]